MTQALAPSSDTPVDCALERIVRWHQISTWPSGFAALQAQLAQHMTALPALPAAVGDSVTLPQDPDTRVLRTGPYEFTLLTLPAATKSASAADVKPPAVDWPPLSEEVAACLDLSHARMALTLRGSTSVATLQKLLAIDIRLTAFPVHCFRLTGMHHVPVLVLRVAEDAFTLLLLSTYAQSLMQSVMQAARYTSFPRPVEEVSV